jgi:hypothetical protein
MDTQRALAVALVAAVLLAASPAAWALTTSVPVQNDIPVTTSQTPTVTLETGSGTDLDIQSFWNGSELDIHTSQGNISVTGDPGASAHLALDDIEGQQTQVTQIEAGSAWLNLNPGDKQRVDVRGDANTLSFQSVGVNDGSTDLQLGGPQGGTAEVRIHGLAAGESYALYDPNADTVLGQGTADGDGTLQTNVDMPDGTQTLQVRTQDDFADPTLSNPQPNGRVTETPDTLSVDVEAEAWPANVTFYLEGEQVGTNTTSSNGTVSTNITVDQLGSYNWSAVVEDEIGQTDTINASFETPTNITFREEHNATRTIDDGNVTLRFYTVDGDIAISRPLTNGTVDMEGLPDSSFVVFAQSDDHYDRSIYVKSIYDQETMYLLNKTEVPRENDSAIVSRFVFEDLTGDFSKGETTVQIQRAVDPNGDNVSEYRIMTGDFWGASSEFEATLEYGVRYRLVVVNQETGARRVVGSHIPTADRILTIRVAGVIEELQQGNGVLSTAQLDAENNTLTVAYNDPLDKTNELRVVVEERGGNQTLINETVGGPLGAYEKTVAINDSQAETDWIATVEANDGQRHRQAIPVGSGVVAFPVAFPQWLVTMLLVMSVTFVGALYGPRTALLGAWAMFMVAAGAAMFGWAFGGPSVIVAGLVAVGVTFLGRAIPG